MSEVGWVYRIRPRSERPWWAMIGPRGMSESGNYRRYLGEFASQELAFAAAEVALFESNHPGCCERCGWSLSSHGHSQYGLDCPGGISPAAKRGHLRIVRRAKARLRDEQDTPSGVLPVRVPGAALGDVAAEDVPGLGDEAARPLASAFLGRWIC